ncbi:MAG: alpha/beta fold hydrolase [Magnetococcales bacterium]|nr:alpha/beta fold hydrolase [Magnetococcales bacterium]
MKDKKAGTVVMVHGLWLDGTELKPLGKRLEKAGYEVVFFKYPTVRAGLVENADNLWHFLESHFGKGMQSMSGATPVHLVCHSLGGLVALHMLHRYPQARIGRMVAIATPFRGCLAARRLSRWPFGSVLLGGSMDQGLFSGGPRSVPQGREIGVIAGRLPLGLSHLVMGMQGPSDGTVQVAETWLDGAVHTTVDHVHLGLVISKRTAQLTQQFLASGKFG